MSAMTELSAAARRALNHIVGQTEAEERQAAERRAHGARSALSALDEKPLAALKAKADKLRAVAETATRKATEAQAAADAARTEHANHAAQLDHERARLRRASFIAHEFAEASDRLEMGRLRLTMSLKQGDPIAAAARAAIVASVQGFERNTLWAIRDHCAQQPALSGLIAMVDAALSEAAEAGRRAADARQEAMDKAERRRRNSWMTEGLL